jgi:predicted dehydrogenase
MRARRLAILGFGHVAELGHLPGWLGRDDFRIVAVADVRPERRERAAALLPGAQIHGDPAVLLETESPDAVDICTPPAFHAPLAAQAARAGCHVLCEKPLATSTADLAYAVRAAHDAGVTLYTVHNWKHCEQFAHAVSVLAEAPIGRLRHVRLETVRNGSAVTIGSEWRGDARLAGGGILFDHGWHSFYLMMALARERPVSIRAEVGRVRDSTSSVEDTARCWLDFPSSTGEIHLTWAGTERRTRWTLECGHGSLLLEDDRGVVRSGGHERALRFPGSLSVGSHHPEWFAAVIAGFADEVADAARRGRNLAEATLCLELTELAYLSAAEGGKLLAVPRHAANDRRAADLPWHAGSRVAGAPRTLRS